MLAQAGALPEGCRSLRVILPIGIPQLGFRSQVVRVDIHLMLFTSYDIGLYRAVVLENPSTCHAKTNLLFTFSSVFSADIGHLVLGVLQCENFQYLPPVSLLP